MHGPLATPKDLDILGELPVNIAIWRSLQDTTETADTNLQYVPILQIKGCLADILGHHTDHGHELPVVEDILTDLVNGLGHLHRHLPPTPPRMRTAHTTRVEGML